MAEEKKPEGNAGQKPASGPGKPPSEAASAGGKAPEDAGKSSQPPASKPSAPATPVKPATPPPAAAKPATSGTPSKPAATKPAAGKPAAPAKPAAKAAPKKPPARPGGAAGVAAAKAAAVAAASPNPTVLKSGTGQVVYRPGAPAEMSRRSFFSWISLGWIAFTAAMGGMVTAATRFMFPNVLFEPPSTFKAGSPSDYAIGKVDERWKEAFGVWLVRTDDGFYALSTTCTHLGCTPNWLPAENKFKCPCHGSGFYATGINFEGPAPRPLERYKISLADDGQILIDKNVKFQQEKGQWESPGAFLNFTA